MCRRVVGCVCCSYGVLFACVARPTSGLERAANVSAVAQYHTHRRARQRTCSAPLVSVVGVVCLCCLVTFFHDLFARRLLARLENPLRSVLVASAASDEDASETVCRSRRSSSARAPPLLAAAQAQADLCACADCAPADSIRRKCAPSQTRTRANPTERTLK